MDTLVGDILDFLSVDNYRSAGDDQICVGVYGICILALHDNGYLLTVDLYLLKLPSMIQIALSAAIATV